MITLITVRAEQHELPELELSTVDQARAVYVLLYDAALFLYYFTLLLYTRNYYGIGGGGGGLLLYTRNYYGIGGGGGGGGGGAVLVVVVDATKLEEAFLEYVAVPAGGVN